jgi:hypothetical protein
MEETRKEKGEKKRKKKKKKRKKKKKVFLPSYPFPLVLVGAMSHKMAEMRRLSKQLSLQNFEGVVEEQETLTVKSETKSPKEDKVMLKDFKLSKR